MGKGNVSVQVNADIDFNSAKSTIESYVPVEEGKNQGVLVSSQTEVETYENPNLVPNSTAVNQRNLNYSKQKTAVNYNVTKEVKQVIYAPGTVKRLSIAVAVNKILTDAEKDELKNLILSASGVDYSRGDVISVSGLQFEGATFDKKSHEDFTKLYQQEQIIDVLITSVIPLVVVFILGLFALIIIRGFITRIPVRKIERHRPEEITIKAQEEEMSEVAPKVEFNRKEIASQKEQNITEINEVVMASPEDAAKLLSSYIRE